MKTDFYDCTGQIGQMPNAYLGEPEWPMYSFNSPSYVVWNTIANVLHKRGWNDEKIKTWLQSKDARWAMDGDLGEMLTNAAKKYAEKNIT